MDGMAYSHHPYIAALLTSYLVDIGNNAVNLVVTRSTLRNTMTLTVVAKELIVDKIELSMRYEVNDFEAINFTAYLLRHLFVNEGRAVEVPRRRYPNNRIPPYAVYIPLAAGHGQYLYVECGSARNWHGTVTTYVKFAFNPNRLLVSTIAQMRFNEVLLAIIPSGGYSVLLEESYVLYAEFSADFRGVTSQSIDAYCTHLRNSRYFPDTGTIKTITLYDDRPGRHEEMCIYDKKESDWNRYRHLRRGPLTRIEARRRFNRSADTRELRLRDLRDLRAIENPFASVRIFDRALIANTFTAKRHAAFLAQAQCRGVHAALIGSRGADRERRERMLQNCQVSWWNPMDAWPGVVDAVNRVLLL